MELEGGRKEEGGEARVRGEKCQVGREGERRNAAAATKQGVPSTSVARRTTADERVPVL